METTVQSRLNFPKTTGDAGHRGFNSLYDEFEEDLGEALDSGEAFSTGWQTLKKQIVSFMVSRDESGGLRVEVTASIDTGRALVDDALRVVVPWETELLPVVAQEIKDIYTEDLVRGVRTSITRSSVPPADASIETVREYLEADWESADEALDMEFNTVKDEVRSILVENYEYDHSDLN